MPAPAQQLIETRPFLGPTEPGTSLLSNHIGAFVQELATGLEPSFAVMKRYGISPLQLKVLLRNNTFRQMVHEAEATFKSITNVGDRIKLKSQLATELLLDHMFSIAADGLAQPNARVQAFAAIRSMTGLEKPETPIARQKFSLTVNVPKPASGEARSITIENDGTPIVEHEDPEPVQTYDEVSSAAHAVKINMDAGRLGPRAVGRPRKHIEIESITIDED